MLNGEYTTYSTSSTYQSTMVGRKAEIAFLSNAIICLKEKLTDKLWLFRLVYMVYFSSKMNKMSLSLQGK